MRKWRIEFEKGSSFIQEFIRGCSENLHFLIEQQLVDPHFIAVAGLSRGGYIAFQLAAREGRINTILGFAPLTQPSASERENPLATAEDGDQDNLTMLNDLLIHKQIRCYIGNHDTRVGTDHCYAFIRSLTEAAFNKGIRSPTFELMIYPSIGFKGHGTPPSIFLEGAEWIKRLFLMRQL